MNSNNIKQTLRIARIELSTLFYSPVAWLVLVIFALLIGYDFADRFEGQMRSVESGRGIYSYTASVYYSQMSGILRSILHNLYLYIPLITMGLMSREYQSGSIKLLYSSPIKNSSIIWGKFLAMMVYGFALVSILGLNVVFSAVAVVNFEWQVMVVALLGIYLLILAYSAIGLFMSTITPYQVVAAIGTLAVLAVLNFIGDVGQSIDFVRNITFWLSIYGRSVPFINGLLPSADLFYFVIVIGLFIGLSIIKLNTEKSVFSWRGKVARYGTLVCGALLLGYFSSLPSMKLYYDATYKKNNTLALESQDAIRDIKGKLTITTYVNLLAEDIYGGLPYNRNYDYGRFEKYIRFKPDIKLKYIYYYDHTSNPTLDEKYKGMSLEEQARKQCKIYGMNFKKVLPPDEFAKIIDLKPEGNKFVRVVEAANGKKVTLRLFNDNEKHPRETELSAAFKRLAHEAPRVGFVQGYGARELNNYGPRGFYFIGYDKWFRYALQNQGFDVQTINLDQPIDDSIAILVVSELRQKLSEQALENLRAYVERGGNMLLLGEYDRAPIMNEIASLVGVHFSDGVIASDNELSSPSIVFADYTPASLKLIPSFNAGKAFGYLVSMPTTVAVECDSTCGFTMTPLLVTEPQSWLEFETKDFADGEFHFNPAAGERKGPFNTLCALSRSINGREQRIIVGGDTDFAANEELNATHSGVEINNLLAITGMFRWLSDDQFPISTSKEEPIDNDIRMPKGTSFWVNLFFVGLLPLALALTGIRLIVRRQRK